MKNYEGDQRAGKVTYRVACTRLKKYTFVSIQCPGSPLAFVALGRFFSFLVYLVALLGHQYECVRVCICVCARACVCVYVCTHHKLQLVWISWQSICLPQQRFGSAIHQSGGTIHWCHVLCNLHQLHYISVILQLCTLIFNLVLNEIIFPSIVLGDPSGQ